MEQSCSVGGRKQDKDLCITPRSRLCTVETTLNENVRLCDVVNVDINVKKSRAKKYGAFQSRVQDISYRNEASMSGNV